MKSVLTDFKCKMCHLYKVIAVKMVKTEAESEISECDYWSIAAHEVTMPLPIVIRGKYFLQRCITTQGHRIFCTLSEGCVYRLWKYHKAKF